MSWFTPGKYFFLLMMAKPVGGDTSHVAVSYIHTWPKINLRPADILFHPCPVDEAVAVNVKICTTSRTHLKVKLHV